MNRTMRWTTSVLCLVALTAGISACGDDNDKSDAQLATYCDKTLQIETAPEPDIDFEHASQEEIATGVKAYASEKLVPLANEIQASAPDEVSDDIAILVAAVEKVAQTGDFEGTFGDAKVDAASKRVHAHDLGACEWKKVDVTANEYAFSGIDDQYEAGPTSFEFTNGGKESHELVLLRKNAGVTETFDQVLDLPEDQARSKVTTVGEIGADPGKDGYVIANLEPGDYMAICFISVGTTGHDHEGDGPPHFTKGMKHGFTVS